jgi:NADH-quinone oxidoreductase subunit J
VLVYAGAIVVLFMFVIMLLNFKPNTKDQLKIPAPELGILVVTLITFFAVAVMLAGDEPGAGGGDMTSAAIEEAGGNTYVVGMVLFTRYLWPFELASVLILLAIIAAIVIAKKDKVEGAEKRGKAVHGTR